MLEKEIKINNGFKRGKRISYKIHSPGNEKDSEEK